MNIGLKTFQSITKSKCYHLVLKMAILSFKNYFIFITILDYYSVVSIN